MRIRSSWRMVALMVALLLTLGTASAFAAGSDPSFSKKWNGYTGSFPVTGRVVDCKRLNLRSSTSLDSDNIVTTVSSGTELTVTGLVGKFAQVEWEGKTLYAYGSYITPIAAVTPAKQEPVTYVYYHYPWPYPWPWPQPCPNPPIVTP